MAKTTVGILTYNSAHSILDTLYSLIHPSQTPFLEHIIIVDNGSQDSTLKLIEDFFSKHQVNHQIILNIENNIGLARRLIVEACQTSLLAFIDSDCLAPRYWLESLVTNYKENIVNFPHLAGVGSFNRLSNQSVFQKTINLLLSSFLGHGASPQGANPKKKKIVDHLATTNCLFKVQAIKEVGNFSPHFSRVCEDVDLGIRLNKNGYKLLLYPNNGVINQSAKDLGSWAARMFRFGAGQMNILWHHAFRKHWPSLVAGPFFVLMIASLLLSRQHEYFLLPFLAYTTIILLASTFICIRKKQWPLISNVFFAFLTTHFSYGGGAVFGFIKGGLLRILKYR